MSSVFLDTDVILDVLAKREPFYGHSARILTLIDERGLTGCTSSLIFTDLFYILRKRASSKDTRGNLRKLYILLTVLAVDERIIDLALSSEFSVFQDAVQYFTAKQHGVPFLITRNIQNYKAAEKGRMIICSPTDFLDLWQARMGVQNHTGQSYPKG